MSKLDKFTQYHKEKSNDTTNINGEGDDRPFQIYVDMDGVLTDFDQDFMDIKINKKNLNFYEYDKKYGKFSAWKAIDDVGLTWWSDMSWRTDGKELWEYVSQYNPTILSAPSRHPNSSRGKVIWVNRELGFDIKSATRSPKPQKWETDSKMILCSQKYLFSKRYNNSILIDDTQKKIDDWTGNGGIGILHKNTKDTIDQLEKILSNLNED